jgi:hypothetical protein
MNPNFNIPLCKQQKKNPAQSFKTITANAAEINKTADKDKLLWRQHGLRKKLLWFLI